ncbi:hypothetical protein SteCoe_9082 [Stentor coeruleus]|uniref:CBM20 domain-containing protein n=1 Tax=Stentor coeruleus TaxID=5963 RepID=A0A1R2CIP5_9CILI|nr:hypothetical protein SteCoe_9082 [Stentor coeruleus]
MAIRTSRVVFQFSSKTIYGERIRVTGNHPSLGNWDPFQAPMLSTDPNSYPLWITPSPISLPLNTEIEYKYVYMQEKTFRWESLQNNRKLLLEHNSMLIEDEESTIISRHIFNHTEIQTKPHSFELPKTIIDDNIKFALTDSLIIASLNLPINVSRNEKYIPGGDEPKWKFESAIGLWLPVLYEIAISEGINFQWVGWPHIFIEDEKEQSEISEILLKEYKCVPIFIPEETMTIYTQFCNGVLFPIFHNIISTDPESIPQYNSEQWESFKDVNSRISLKILELHTDQMIWIHDYQLLLTPSFISRRTHEVVNIGLYLHVPFPSSEIYRVLPHRETILHAMLCCDMIGFHLFEYARHFLASCKRLLGIDHHFSRGGYLLLDYYGRNIMIRIGHLGIEPSVIQKVLESEEYSESLDKLRQKYSEKSVLIAIDPLHRLSGVTMKLNAFRQTLKYLPKESQRIILVQLLFSAKNSSDKEKDCVLKEILDLQEEINSEYTVPVVEIVNDEVSRPMRYAYMTIAKGVINSSIREGLYLIPFEFIFINKERLADIILSEFAGVSRALSSPKRVNPFDLTQLEGEIHTLIDKAPNHQNLSRKKRDYQYILSNTTLKWAQSSLSDLKRAHKDTKHYQYVTHGLGDKLKLIALSKKFKILKAEDLLEAYRVARSRIFFFDNEGTLSNLCKQTEIDKTVGPSEKILHCLDDLCKDDRNIVYIITGRTRKVVDSWFGSIEHLGMAAEYGALIKWQDKHDWENIIQGSGVWKDTAKQIISAYVSRTEGSSLEEKDCGVVFYYRETDPDLGSWQAKELISHLEILLKPFLNECEVSHGLGYVEVKPRGINKGTTVFEILQELKRRKKDPPDFIFAIGDDVSDEEMFKVLKALRREQSDLTADKRYLKCFTCTVGKKPSLARHFINDASEVVGVLEILRGYSNKCKKNFSYGDLASLKLHSPFKSNTMRNPTDIVIESVESSDEDEDEKRSTLKRMTHPNAF